MRKLFFDETIDDVREIETMEIPTTEKMFFVTFDEGALRMRTEELAFYEFTITIIDENFCCIEYSNSEDREWLENYFRKCEMRDGHCLWR